mgnify:CR=1 FL=1
MPDLILAALITGPLIITFLLKSNAALGFLSLCAGSVLVTYANSDIKNGLQQIGAESLSNSAVALGLLTIPLAVTLLLTRKSVANKSKLLFHAIPAACAGGLLALSAVPFLSDTVQADFASSELWLNLQKAQTLIIGAGAITSLALVWLGSLKRHGKKHHK